MGKTYEEEWQRLLFLGECLLYLILFIIIVAVVFFNIEEYKYRKNRPFKKPKKF
jgi:hypothetical protein